MNVYVVLNDKEVNFHVAVNLMDDEIREAIHNDMAPCSMQAFIDEYCKRHYEKYGEDFTVN